MDTINVSHVDNPVRTPPPTQCSRADEDNKRPYLSSSSNVIPSSSTDPPSTSHTPPPRSSTSPPPSCAICLGAFVNKCMPDICLHQFCFNCLLQWSKVKAVCPLCKRPFVSIIHNVRSNYEYDEHVIERPEERPPEYYLPNAPQARHFQFRTTFTVDPRGELAIQQMLSSHPLTFPLGIYEPFTHRLHRHADRPGRITRSDRRSYVSSTAYRRSIYEQGLWVVANPDGADMHREATPDFYRNNEGAIARLVPWLNRELSVLMHHASTEQVANLIDMILAALPRHHILSRYMLRDVLQPYLHHDSEHFSHEFYNYMRSPLDMIGYDRSCVHGPRVIDNVILDDETSSDTSDSTVQLLNNRLVTADSTGTERFRFPLFVPAPLPADYQPTTSSQSQIGSSTQVMSNDVIEIDDSDGNDSDVILQTPPPPTIVDLLGDTSDSEVDGGGIEVQQQQQQQLEEDTPTTTLASAIRQSLLLDTSSVQEVDSNEPGPSTSHSTRKRKRCNRHDEYMVDRKTVLPLKIRLKRKRHHPSSKRSCSKSRHCCKNGGTGGYSSSSSSNDTSLQSRLKRRKKFHKKKYYLRKQFSSSSSSSSRSTSSKSDDKGLFAFSSSDDDEPLSSALLRSRKVKEHCGEQGVSTDVISGAVASTSGGSRVKTKREMRDEMRAGKRQNVGGRSGVPPPGVFEPSVPCPSPLISPTSSERSSRTSSRYTPDLLVNQANTAHFNPYDHPTMPSQSNNFINSLYHSTSAHLYRRESHTPPLPSASYAQQQEYMVHNRPLTSAHSWDVAGPSTVNQQELRDPMWNGLRNREDGEGGGFCMRGWMDKEPSFLT